MKSVVALAAALAGLVGYGHAFVPKAGLPQGSSTTVRGRGDVSMRAERMPIAKGSLVALVTPMEENGNIDESALRDLLKWHVASKTDGLVVLGTTGEASVMTMEERARVLEITQEEAKGKVPIIVGTGTINPKTIVELTQQAVDYGADGSLIVTPYYVKPPPNALVQHFKFLADAVDLPMILYNVPGRTGVDLKPETVALCAEHPGIVGIKEATGDVPRVGALRELVGKDFLLYSGDDESGAEFVLRGGDGVISVTSNVVPELQHKIMAAALKGDRATVEKLNQPLGLLHKRLFLQANPIPVKWVLTRMGKIPAGIRRPLQPLEQPYHAPLEKALEEAGLIKEMERV